MLARPAAGRSAGAREIEMVLDAVCARGQARRVAVNIYGPREIAGIRRAGAAAAATLAWVGARLAPGVTTAQIDAWVREDTARRGGRPSQLGYHGFPASVCTSRNEVVCHGMPRPDVVLRAGDIVNVDVTTEYGGFHGDTSATFCIGEVDADTRRLVETTLASLHAGIAAVRPGARLGDIGAAIEEVAGRARFGVVREYCGHGIGRQMHEPPQVSHVGRAGSGLRLRPGMVFTIEPMLTAGSPEIRVLSDGWTVVTADGEWSAQFEHTIAVTEDGAEVITAPVRE
jgi:methionyl aminopeptidase